MKHVRWLKFSADGRFVTSDIGARRLPVLSSAVAAAGAAAASSYALAVEEQWLTCDLERLLWFPSHFRPAIVATSNQTIALGQAAGDVITMSFDFSSERPWEEVMF
jgi:hypothetical protein